MRYVTLGPAQTQQEATQTQQTALPPASVLVLGTDYYGKTIPEPEARTLLETYLELGGNVIDTAHVYSDYLPGETHMSEKVIGRFLRDSGVRSRVILATKGGFPELGDMHASRISCAQIRRDLEESLQCLRQDAVDLYWLHRDNPHVPVGEIVDWMDALQRTGMFRVWGVSNWQASRIAQAVEYARRTGRAAPFAGQIKWSLARTSTGAVDDDTLVEMDETQYRWYAQTGMPVFAYSSQAKGYFSKFAPGAVLPREVTRAGAEVLADGAVTRAGADAAPADPFAGVDPFADLSEMPAFRALAGMPGGKAGKRYNNLHNLRVFSHLRALSAKTGEPESVLALGWLLASRPFPVFPIVGCRTPAQLRESMRAADFESGGMHV